MFVKHHDDVPASTVEFDGARYGNRTYFSSADGADAPHVFLVEQAPGVQLATHFHGIDQFQVVVRGSGTLGREPVAPLTVHYADAYTGYGPIQSSPEGLWYFSIRPRHEPAGRARILPDARHAQPRVRHRHRVAQTDPATIAGGPPVATLFTDPDGLAARSHRLATGESVALGRATGSGRCVLVVAGSVAIGGATCPALSCVFAPAGEDVVMAAGSGGATMLVLDFPPDSRMT